jgi:CelD/BcsL family acetyltransferase involved in cellulose biosynthesis
MDLQHANRNRQSVIAQRAVQTELIQTEAAFAALEDAWWDLWRRCPAATPFQAPAWSLPWWRHFSPGSLHVIAVWREEVLVGLAPLYVDCSETGSRLVPVGISLSDYLDLLVDPDFREPAAAAISEAIRQSGLRYDGEELRPEACSWALSCPPDAQETAQAQSACPTLALSGGEDLQGCVPARRRRQLRRAIAAAERKGQLSIEAVAPDSVESFLGMLFRLHGARWRERGEPGVLDDPVVQAFHRATLPLLIAAGLARCFVLKIGGEIAGAYYGMAERTRAYAYLGGFDPAFSDESPGAILIGHAIAQAIREDRREFHFLRGQEAYKYTWGARDRWNRRRSFYPAEHEQLSG